jgi:hypothetical protein
MRHSTANSVVRRVYGVTEEVRSVRGRRRGEEYMWKTGYVPQYTFASWCYYGQIAELCIPPYTPS